MAQVTKISMAQLANEQFCPEGWEQYEHEVVKLEDIIGKEIGIIRFIFRTSKNTEKYNAGNEEAVHFMFTANDKLYRVGTHAVKIVRGFHALEKAIGCMECDIPVETKIVKKKLDNGREMFDFEF